MMRTGNPALSGNVFSGVSDSYEGSMTMTIGGTVNKTLVLLLLTLLTASWAWGRPVSGINLIFPAAITGFIAALITIFKKEWSMITAPLYALIEGVLLGGISIFFEKAYPGIAFQAVALTFGVLFCMLIAYKSGLIRATDKFKLGIVAATGAIALIYFVSIILSFFSIRVPVIYGSGPVGIAFSLIVVGIAALNLVLDFDFIEQGANSGALKYMEWYAAFSLMVTLIWLYMEILRLLSKLRNR
ncbi:MAG: Bax inhibitor-1/YccA family protein [Candidatus Omnitrophota bacterium]